MAAELALAIGDHTGIVGFFFLLSVHSSSKDGREESYDFGGVINLGLSVISV